MTTPAITYKVTALTNTGQIAHIENFRDINSAIRQRDVYTKLLNDTGDNSYYTEFFVIAANS